MTKIKLSPKQKEVIRLMRQKGKHTSSYLFHTSDGYNHVLLYNGITIPIKEETYLSMKKKKLIKKSDFEPVYHFTLTPLGQSINIE